MWRQGSCVVLQAAAAAVAAVAVAAAGVSPLAFLSVQSYLVVQLQPARHTALVH